MLRRIARELFAGDAPGQGGTWAFTEEQVQRLRQNAPQRL